jgi:hypothetical protein
VTTPQPPLLLLVLGGVGDLVGFGDEQFTDLAAQGDADDVQVLQLDAGWVA